MFTKDEVLYLKNELDKTNHCGDYGRFYLNKKEKILFCVFGDADNNNLDYLKDTVYNLKIIIEAEYDPCEDSKDWILVSCGTEQYENYKTGKTEFFRKSLVHDEWMLLMDFIEKELK